jgi:very-short-patch-repair endonuclease
MPMASGRCSAIPRPSLLVNDLFLHHWPLFAAGAGTAVLGLVAFFSLRDGPPPYEKRGTLLSPAERNFLLSLESAVRSDWQIFGAVRLADLVKVRAKTRKFQWWQNRLLSKRVDFVLCDIETMEAKLVIELDDRTQRHPDRYERDRFIYQTLASAGIPLIRVRVEERYESAYIRKGIEDALGIVRKAKKRW